MTKEEFSNMLGIIEEGDRIFFLKVNKKNVQKITHGFVGPELIGYLDVIIDEIKTEIRRRR